MNRRLPLILGILAIVLGIVVDFTQNPGLDARATVG